jgi:diaminohydroxyphosphoribosylaminopyrimidine deaminase/5-amino-6-(5-phosphoribosylamino)uracil reductase
LGVTLKLATSLDGRIATASGESRWITGEAARQAVHRLRTQHDAVVIGVETALADDPELTIRLEGYAGPQPARVVFDSRQRLQLHSKLVRTAREIPTVVVSVDPPGAELAAAGVRVLQVQDVGDGRPELKAAVRALAGIG